MLPRPRSLFTPLLLALACLNLRAADVPEFASWPAGDSPQEIGGRVAARFLATPHGNPGHTKPIVHIPYPEVCAWYGALAFAQATGDAGLRQRLVDRFEPLFREERSLVPVPEHVDYTVFAAVPLELFRQTGDRRDLVLGEWMAGKEWDEPFGRHVTADSRAYARQGYSWQTRLWIDDMYMITLPQVQAWRATGLRRYLDRAAKEMSFYLDRLQQANGLFLHAPDAPFYWGRGNGWVAAGMAELLRDLPADHPERARVLRGYRAMMAALLSHQDRNGMWHQLIDDPTAWPETSATAMFAFAMVTGVREGWLEPTTYAPAARRAWLGLAGYLDADANVREVCEGTNKNSSRQYYLDRKRMTGDFHGQAPLLWTAAALLR